MIGAFVCSCLQSEAASDGKSDAAAAGFLLFRIRVSKAFLIISEYNIWYEYSLFTNYV